MECNNSKFIKLLEQISVNSMKTETRARGLICKTSDQIVAQNNLIEKLQRDLHEAIILRDNLRVLKKCFEAYTCDVCSGIGYYGVIDHSYCPECNGTGVSYGCVQLPRED